MLSTGWVVFIAIIALLIGAIGGFFAARKYLEKYLQENPPIDEDMLRMMMAQMGQKPSEKKVRQMMQNMKSQAKNKDKKK